MKEFFEGWYYKISNSKTSIAFIPAFLIDDEKNKIATIQVITEDKSYNFNYSMKDVVFEKDNDLIDIKIQNNIFNNSYFKLDLKNEEVEISGIVHLGKHNKLSKDIMGPFKNLPFMECKHGVVSMIHSANGVVCVNEKEYLFNDDLGYIEKDSGSSFPDKYLWTQTFFPNSKNDSLMLAVATIPYLGIKFTGVICAIYYKGNNYLFATYNGAKIKYLKNNKVIIKKGKHQLTVERLHTNGKNLYAPVKGDMKRIIKESIVCEASYELKYKEDIIFSFVTKNASFEFEF